VGKWPAEATAKSQAKAGHLSIASAGPVETMSMNRTIELDLDGSLAPFFHQSTQGKIFREYGSAIAAFGSGYLLGKADKLVARLFDPDLYGTDGNIFRAASVAVAFLVTTAVIFVVRTNASPEHNAPE
jgi:hypothetical protein